MLKPICWMIVGGVIVYFVEDPTKLNMVINLINNLKGQIS